MLRPLQVAVSMVTTHLNMFYLSTTYVRLKENSGWFPFAKTPTVLSRPVTMEICGIPSGRVIALAAEMRKTDLVGRFLPLLLFWDSWSQAPIQKGENGFLGIFVNDVGHLYVCVQFFGQVTYAYYKG